MKYIVERKSTGFATDYRPTFLSRVIFSAMNLIYSLAYFIKSYFLLMPFVVFWYVSIGIAFYDAAPADFLTSVREVIFNCFMINLVISGAAMFYNLGCGPAGRA